MAAPVLSTEFARALALHQQGNDIEADRICAEILAHAPRDFNALLMRAFIAVRQDRHDEAMAFATRATELAPQVASGHRTLGMALQRKRRYEQALVAFDRALVLRPDDAEALLGRGTVLAYLHRYAEALVCHDRALALRPEMVAAYIERGAVLRALKRHQEALASADRAIALRPDAELAHFHRGMVLYALRREEEALASYDRAIALKPDFADAHANRGQVLLDLGLREEAVAAYDLALAIDPNDAESHLGRAVALGALNRHGDALAGYDASIALRPMDTRTQWNRALCLLVLGRFAEGWREYEWRTRLDTPIGVLRCDRPLWLGEEAVAGRALLVHAEQGFGDTLQFCRYVTPLRALGAHVILAAPRSLMRLLTTLGPGVAVVDEARPLPPFELHCPLLSLPLALRTTLETIPAPARYLAAEPGAVAAWRARAAPLPGLKVGLVWAGGLRPDQVELAKIDARRSMPLAALAPLAAVPGVSFISLQKGPPAAQARIPPAGMALHDWTDELGDFADTAALVEALDLVISVDTSVVHLAGALGKPVWVLNRFDTCWRWLLERTDSPWYPSLRLFRQPRPGDWGSVVADVARALAERAEHQTSA